MSNQSIHTINTHNNMQRNKINFKGQKIFVGIDVHKNSWQVTSLTETGLKRTHLQNNASAKELHDFLNRYYPEGEYIAVYEAGFSGFSTYYALKEQGIECMVIHAADVPTSQYETLMKSDKVDSEKLAKALRAGTLKGIYIREKENLDDRSLVRIRTTIVGELSAYRHRIKHLLMTHGIELPEPFASMNNCWNKAFIKWLREDVILMSSTRRSLDSLIDQVESVRKNLLQITLEIRKLSRSSKYSERMELLRSVPGIGLICSMSLLTEIYDFERFHNEREFASYLGLIPTSHSSGDKVVHGEKTFRGNKQLGPLLIQGSWVAVRKDSVLSSAFSKYLRRMTPQKAIVRIARKMSNIIFAVLKTGKKYVPFEGNK